MRTGWSVIFICDVYKAAFSLVLLIMSLLISWMQLKAWYYVIWRMKTLMWCLLLRLTSVVGVYCTWGVMILPRYYCDTPRPMVKG